MRITAVIFMLGLVASCQIPLKINSGQHYAITEANLSIIPYQGKEELVFVSSENDTLRLFTEGLQQDTIGSDPFVKNPDYFDRYICRFEPSRDDKNFDGAISIKLLAKRDKDVVIEFNIALNHIGFYGQSYFYGQQLFADIPLTKFTLGTATFNDVKVFEGNGRFEERDNYVKKLYWSQAHGFLGFDNKTKQWRLLLSK